MAREWYHYPSGVKTVWPVAALPSSESVYRADFLNQFVRWGNYLHAVGGSKAYGDWPARRTSPVTSDTIIQTATFWNSLLFWPGNDFLAQPRSAFASGTALHNWKSSIYDSFHFPWVPLVAVGSDIHPREAPSCFIRDYCRKLRARLDFCQSVKVNGGWRANGYWAEYGQTVGESEYSTRDGSQLGTMPDLWWYAARAANNPSRVECRNSWFSDATVTTAAGAAVVSHWPPPPPGPSFRPTPWPCPTNHTSGIVVAAKTTTSCADGWLALPGDFGKAASPVFLHPDEWAQTHGAISVIHFPLDSIPT